MIFEIYTESELEKVRSFLKENDIVYEERDEVYDSWDGINLFDTLTEMFGANPNLDGNDVVDEVYKRVPAMVEKLRNIYKHDKGYGIEDSPYLQMDNKIKEYYTGIINEELEKLVEEGIIERISEQ